MAKPFFEGEKYFIRTLTHYYVGEVWENTNGWLTLQNAAWVADTGPFKTMLETGKPKEYEAFPDQVHIPVSSIIDATSWRHDLLTGSQGSTSGSWDRTKSRSKW